MITNIDPFKESPPEFAYKRHGTKMAKLTCKRMLQRANVQNISLEVGLFTGTKNVVQRCTRV